MNGCGVVTGGSEKNESRFSAGLRVTDRVRTGDP